MKSVATIISPYVSPVLINYKNYKITIFPPVSLGEVVPVLTTEAHEEVAIALIVRCGGHATQATQDPILEAMDVVPHQTMA